MIPEFTSLIPLISRIAEEELLPRFSQVEARTKQDGSIVTDADFSMQERIRSALAELTPSAPLLGEEMSTQQQDAVLEEYADKGMWCLDPLDGTSNFASGIPFFSISLAYIQQRRPVMGLVFDPIRNECFTASESEPPAINGMPIMAKRSTAIAPTLHNAIATVDFKRLPPPLASRLITSPPYRSQRNFGSVALEWCWLAANRFQVYLHGRQKLWDYAAGAYIFSKIENGRAETLQGAPLFNPALQTTSAMAATHPETFRQWKDWLLSVDREHSSL